MDRVYGALFLSLLALTAAVGLASRASAQMVNAQTGTTYTVKNSDCGVIPNYLVTFDNASPVAVTLPEAGWQGQFAAGCVINVENIGTGTVTITPTVSTINAGTTLAVTSGQSVSIFNDSTPIFPGNYWALKGSGTGGGGGTPGGSSGQVQYNSAGSFGGATSLTYSGTTVSNSGVFASAVGSNSAPTLTFTGDTTTGIYQSATSNIDFGVAGSNVFNIAASGVTSQGIVAAGGSSVTGLTLSGGAAAGTILASGATNSAVHITGSGTGGLTVASGDGTLFAAQDSGGGSSVVNYITSTATATGGNPTITAANSGDATVNLFLSGKSSAGLVEVPSQALYLPRNMTLSGSFTPSQSWLDATGTVGGTVSSGDAAFVNIGIAGDTVAAPSLNLVNGFRIEHTFGGGAATGGRTAINAYLDLTSATGNTSSTEYTAIVSESRADANDGGTAGAGNSAGAVWGQNTIVRLNTGATYFSYVADLELDETVAANTFPANKIGIKISSGAGDADNGTETDAGMVLSAAFIGATPSAGWGTGIQFGQQDSYFPLPSTGTLIGTQLTATPAVNHIRSPFAATGIDFSLVNFSSYFLNGGPFTVSGLGAADIGPLAIAPTTTGVTIDTALSQSSAPTPAVAGTSYYVGDLVFIAGSQATVASINGSGGITGLTQIVPGYSASPPSGNQVALGGSGQGAQATLTWTAAKTMFLNSSRGEVVVGPGTALANNATAGFFHLPYTNGTPTGTPANIFGDSCSINAATQTLNCYIGASYYHVTLSAGAG